MSGARKANESVDLTVFSETLCVMASVLMSLAELAAFTVLYESAFAALVQIHGRDARSRITQITLMAGFASTVFWPLSQWLLTEYGWRTTFIVFAAMNFFMCAPLHFFALRTAKAKAKPENTEAVSQTNPQPLIGVNRQRAVVFYGAAIVISGLVFSAVPVHMLRIIANEGFSANQAALVAMIMGPVQVFARIIEVTAGQRITPLITGCISLAALSVSLVALLLAPASVVTALIFAGTYGAAQGLITIARGTIPLHLFGPIGYATFVGKVTGIRLIANAFSPFLFAALMTCAGVDAAVLACALYAALGLWAMVALQRLTCGTHA